MRDRDLYIEIVTRLEKAGEGTPYAADANEPDPRYLGYGVRAPEMKKLISKIRPRLSSMAVEEKAELATQLIESGYGEQKTVALHLLDQIVDYFSPERFDIVDRLIRQLHGWSKIDAYTGSFLRSILDAYPHELLEVVRQWNSDDELWLRRASVVLFTRKVASWGTHTTTALELCRQPQTRPGRSGAEGRRLVPKGSHAHRQKTRNGIRDSPSQAEREFNDHSLCDTWGQGQGTRVCSRCPVAAVVVTRLVRDRGRHRAVTHQVTTIGAGSDGSWPQATRAC